MQGAVRRRTAPAPPDDRGVATVWAVGALAVLMVALVAGLHLGGALVARHHAESAADLAALAGAGRVVAGPEHACREAGRIATAMKVYLSSCRVRGWDVLVVVTTRQDGPLARLGTPTGRARAGPAPGPVAR